MRLHLTPASFTSKGAAQPLTPLFCPPLLSSYALTQSLHLFTTRPSLPAPCYVLVEEVCHCRGKATTSVLGWLQSWGRRGWCALCMASYTAAEIHGIHIRKACSSNTADLCDDVYLYTLTRCMYTGASA